MLHFGYFIISWTVQQVRECLSLDQSLYSVGDEQQLYLYNALSDGRVPYILVKLGHSTCSLDRSRFRRDRTSWNQEGLPQVILLPW